MAFQGQAVCTEWYLSAFNKLRIRKGRLTLPRMAIRSFYQLESRYHPAKSSFRFKPLECRSTCSTTSFNLTPSSFCPTTGSWNWYFKTLPSLKLISRVDGSVLERGSCLTVTLTVERAAGGRRERKRRGVLAWRAKGLKEAVRVVRWVVFILEDWSLRGELREFEYELSEGGDDSCECK
jgi:hypothetical protein